jgi:hypothetical protein
VLRVLWRGWRGLELMVWRRNWMMGLSDRLWKDGD